VAIRVELVHHDRALLAAVAQKSGLRISSQVQSSRQDSLGHRPLPDRGSHSLSLLFHVPRQADMAETTLAI